MNIREELASIKSKTIDKIIAKVKKLPCCITVYCWIPNVFPTGTCIIKELFIDIMHHDGVLKYLVEMSSDSLVL